MPSSTNPPLLLLDETTSVLDVGSIPAVQRELEAAMEDGGIVEIGTHASLVVQNGLPASLTALQFSQPQ